MTLKESWFKVDHVNDRCLVFPFDVPLEYLKRKLISMKIPFYASSIFHCPISSKIKFLRVKKFKASNGTRVSENVSFRNQTYRSQAAGACIYDEVLCYVENPREEVSASLKLPYSCHYVDNR